MQAEKTGVGGFPQLSLITSAAAAARVPIHQHNGALLFTLVGWLIFH